MKRPLYLSAARVNAGHEWKVAGSRQAIGLQEGHDFLPDRRRLEHERIVRSGREFPQVFCTGVAVIQAQRKSFWHDHVLSACEHGERAVVGAQVILCGESVAKKQSSREDPDVRLGYIDQTVIRRKQNQTRDFIRIVARQPCGNPCAQRLADDIDRRAGRKFLQGFGSGLFESGLCGLAWPLRIAWVLNGENIEWRSLLKRVGKVSALNGARGVAVSDEHPALRRLRRGRPHPAHGDALRSFPFLKLAGLNNRLHLLRFEDGWSVDQPSLETSAASTNEQVNRPT